MKAYTDLEQSKKLAEILPLESADMCFNTRNNMPPLMTPYSKFNEFFGMEKTPDFLIPCWSLAALLGVLPKEQHPELLMNAHYKWVCNISNPSSFAYKPTVGNNPLDAIFEMIIKLHEQKLL